MIRVSLISILMFFLLLTFSVPSFAGQGFGKIPELITGKIKELRNGDVETSSSSGKMVIKKEFHTAAHLYRFGELFEDQGDTRMAKKYYRMAHEKDPDHHMAKVKLGLAEMTDEERVYSSRWKGLKSVSRS